MQVSTINFSDVDRVAKLLTSVGFSVSGVSHPLLAKWVCEDAVADRGAVVVCSKNGMVSGAAVAVRCAPTYWRRFLYRHPFFALRIIKRRFTRTRPGTHSSPSCAQFEGSLDAFSTDWNTRDPGVARVLLIAVDPSERGKGISSALYENVFDALKKRGSHTLLAQIASDNAASLALHRRTGWVLARRGGQWQGMRRL